MNDIILPGHRNSKAFLFKITKQNEENWIITVGNWEEIEARKDLKTTKDILIGKQGLLDLSNEIKRVIDCKPKEEENLKITFIKNEPQFKIKCLYVYTDGISHSPYTENKYEISVGFNINYSAVKDNREELRYLYENGGRHTFITQEYTKEELLQFVKNIEKEIKFNPRI